MNLDHLADLLRILLLLALPALAYGLGARPGARTDAGAGARAGDSPGAGPGERPNGPATKPGALAQPQVEAQP